MIVDMSKTAVALAEKKTTHTSRFGKAIGRYGLTPKQLRFVQLYIANGGNGTQAAMQAYDAKSENVARAMASENLIKPSVANCIHDVMLKQLATPAFAASRLHFFALNAEKEDTQLKATEDIAKIHGMFKSSDDMSGRSKTTVNIVNIGLPKAEKRQIIDIMAEELANDS